MDCHTLVANKNYITPEGFKVLQEELIHLIKVDRPEIVKVVSWAASNGDRSENGDYIYGKKKLRQLDARIKYLLINIEDANIVYLDPNLERNKVFFGAHVKLFDLMKDSELVIRVVGQQEIGVDKESISYVSPLAKALIGKAVGDEISVTTPEGEHLYQIQTIDYK